MRISDGSSDVCSSDLLWSQMTVGKDDVRFISGPPRVFDGKVIIGHGGADVGSLRGYVTAYDADTGKQLWRFWKIGRASSRYRGWQYVVTIVVAVSVKKQ